MSSLRAWLFRGLVISVAGLMLISWILPWWGCDFYELGVEDVVRIYPYGLWVDVEAMGEFTSYIKGAEMPVWFAPLMWTYLGICVVLLLFSLFAKEKAVSLGKLKFSLSKVLIGGVGLSYILVAVIAVIVAAIRTGDYFDTPLQGYFFINLGEPVRSGAEAGLLLGYWLACSVGPLLIVLALLRNKIMGKPRLTG